MLETSREWCKRQRSQQTTPPKSILRTTHALCLSESSCCTDVAASTPEPSPNPCPQEQIHSTPPSLLLFSVQCRCSQSCCRKAARSRLTPAPEGALIMLSVVRNTAYTRARAHKHPTAPASAQARGDADAQRPPWVVRCPILYRN